jgi:uncharacterized membrane protein YfcA
VGFLEVPLVGLVVGFLLGLTSLGGGSLLTPVLILFLRVNPVIAVGSDLVCQAITRLAGLPVHVRHGTVDRRLLILLASGSLPGTLIGSAIVASLHTSFNRDKTVLTMLGVALVLTALAIMLDPLAARFRERARQEAGSRRGLTRGRAAVIVLGGFAVGLSVGTTSVGAGSLLMVMLVMLCPLLSARRLVGTDLAHGVVLLPVSGLLALSVGHVDLSLVAMLLVGSIPGVLLGSRLSVLLPERPLRLTVAGMVFFTGLRLLPVGI